MSNPIIRPDSAINTPQWVTGTQSSIAQRGWPASLCYRPFSRNIDNQFYRYVLSGANVVQYAFNDETMLWEANHTFDATSVLPAGEVFHNIRPHGLDSSANAIMFAHYNDDAATASSIWRSLDNGLTWHPVLTRTAGAHAERDIRHWHNIAYDPFFELWWASSGDTDAEVEMWVSNDDGDNWVMVGSGTQTYRTLNFVFTEDKIYWATDCLAAPGPEFVIHTKEAGFPFALDKEEGASKNISTLEINNFSYGVALNPFGIVIPTRYTTTADGSRDASKLVWYLYAFEDSALHTLIEFSTVGVTTSPGANDNIDIYPTQGRHCVIILEEEDLQTLKGSPGTARWNFKITKTGGTWGIDLQPMYIFEYNPNLLL